MKPVIRIVLEGYDSWVDAAFISVLSLAIQVATNEHQGNNTIHHPHIILDSDDPVVRVYLEISPERLP